MRMPLLVVCLFAVQSCCPLAMAQAAATVFDAAPLILPHSVSEVPRVINSMDLLELRQVHGIAVSPDGGQVAFVVGQASVASNSYRTGIFIVGTSGKKPPISLGSAGMPHWDSVNQWSNEAPQWSHDGRLLTFRIKMRAEENWQVWIGDRDGAAMKPLTHVAGDVVAYKWDYRSNKILLEVQAPATEEMDQSLRQRGILYDDHLLPWQGMSVILEKLKLQERKTRIWVHEIGTNLEREATDAEKEWFAPDLKKVEQTFNGLAGVSTEPCHVGSAKVSPDNRAVVLLCAPETNPSSSKIMQARLYVMERDGQPPELVSESYWMTDYWWDRTGELLYYVSIAGDGHTGHMNVFDRRSRETHEFFRSTEMLRDFSMDSASQHIACTRETNISPAQIAVMDEKNGSLRTLVDLNPEFQYRSVNPVERIAGVNRFDEEWFGHVVKPRGYEAGKRYPLIVTLYRSGDGFLLGASGNENPIQVYAAHGFAVLNFDIGRFRNRKTGDFEDSLLDWSSPTASLEMAVETLVDAGMVDPKRVGIAGFSHGAEILEYAISHTHTFQAAVESGPAARDPYFYYMSGKRWRDLFAELGLGGWPETESMQSWKRLAASLNADQIATPLLVNAADSEFIASLALCTSLEDLHKPVELFIYADELHLKNQPKHLHEIYERNLDWFCFWLQNGEDSSAAKGKQYARWRKLREKNAGHRGEAALQN